MSIKYDAESLYSYKELVVSELPVLRAKARLSQEDVAKGIGISRQTYNSIETGKKDVSLTIFFALIAFFQNNSKTEDMICSIFEAGKKTEVNKSI